MRLPQAQPRTAPPTRVDGSDVTMDQEVPRAGTPMAVPINFRFMRSSVDTDASIRIPMRRAADHRSDNKGSPMDGHTKCPHGTSGCKHVCDVHSCVTSWSCNYIQNPAHTLACRLAWPWQTLPCARWSDSVEGHGLFHECCCRCNVVNWCCGRLDCNVENPTQYFALLLFYHWY